AGHARDGDLDDQRFIVSVPVAWIAVAIPRARFRVCVSVSVPSVARARHSRIEVRRIKARQQSVGSSIAVEVHPVWDAVAIPIDRHAVYETVTIDIDLLAH